MPIALHFALLRTPNNRKVNVGICGYFSAIVGKIIGKTIDRGWVVAGFQILGETVSAWGEKEVLKWGNLMSTFCFS